MATDTDQAQMGTPPLHVAPHAFCAGEHVQTHQGTMAHPAPSAPTTVCVTAAMAGPTALAATNAGGT